jgi:hypothetical protein
MERGYSCLPLYVRRFFAYTCSCDAIVNPLTAMADRSQMRGRYAQPGVRCVPEGTVPRRRRQGSKQAHISKVKGIKVGIPVKTTAPAYKFTNKISSRYEVGIDFTLDDKATAVKFDLTINGKAVPILVYIGEKGSHPKAGVFQLPAKPGKE